jgi:UDP-glucose 4-epimerase
MGKIVSHSAVYMKKKILIIGSEGFIGRHCVTYYLNAGWDVYGCDLVAYSFRPYNYMQVSRLNPGFEDAFKNIQYAACINAAGNGSVPVSIEHPLSDFDANCSDVIRLLELIRKKNKDCRYLHISSAAVYGNPLELPVQENAALVPLSPYGWHKYISEMICREYATLYGIAIAIVRPFSIFGPGLYKQFFWDLHQKCKLSKTPALWGTGAESRDFIYIHDLIKALDIVLLKSPMNADVYNIANGIETTVAEASKLFIKYFGEDIDIRFNKQVRQGDPQNWQANISRITTLGYENEFSFESGIKETVKWLKDLE